MNTQTLSISSPLFYLKTFHIFAIILPKEKSFVGLLMRSLPWEVVNGRLATWKVVKGRLARIGLERVWERGVSGKGYERGVSGVSVEKGHGHEWDNSEMPMVGYGHECEMGMSGLRCQWDW